MQRGDIFRVPEDEQLYYVEEISPSGTVYAHRYDLYAGCYGMPLALQITNVREILFNVHQPPTYDSNHEYCQINIERSFDDPEGWSGFEWFIATTIQTESPQVVAQSTKLPFVRGEPMLFRHRPHNQRLHRNLVEQLLTQNWQPILERRLNWYQWTFQRLR